MTKVKTTTVMMEDGCGSWKTTFGLMSRFLVLTGSMGCRSSYLASWVCWKKFGLSETSKLSLDLEASLKGIAPLILELLSHESRFFPPLKMLRPVTYHWPSLAF